MLGEREFFIRKAIGWVLREEGHRRPDVVAAWLLPRAGRASGVTITEAVKYLAPDQVTAIKAARPNAFWYCRSSSFAPTSPPGDQERPF